MFAGKVELHIILYYIFNESAFIFVRFLLLFKKEKILQIFQKYFPYFLTPIVKSTWTSE